MLIYLGTFAASVGIAAYGDDKQIENHFHNL